MEWLKQQLTAERQQGVVRLSSCGELQRQVQELEDEAKRHREEAEHWQAEYNEKEEGLK